MSDDNRLGQPLSPNETLFKVSEYSEGNKIPAIKENPIFADELPEIIETPEPLPSITAEKDFENETEERIRIQNMTTEETMQFLAQSLNEINGSVFADFSDTDYENNDESEYEQSSENSQSEDEPNDTADEPVQSSVVSLSEELAEISPKEDSKYATLTKEPFWGDIYIKASRNLRELCEQNKLSMKDIEAEVNEKLLEAAGQFAAVTKEKSQIPKVLIPKITELKAAVKNSEQYFQAGEDVAVRAMFFMLYQMLSYADRIAETPQTKENLNDFFRRFGPAGIMFSMLDVRV